jgi:hypothetical protein
LANDQLIKSFALPVARQAREAPFGDRPYIPNTAQVDMSPSSELGPIKSFADVCLDCFIEAPGCFSIGDLFCKPPVMAALWRLNEAATAAGAERELWGF